MLQSKPLLSLIVFSFTVKSLYETSISLEQVEQYEQHMKTHVTQ